MITMKAVLRYHGVILSKSNRPEGIALSKIKYREGEKDSFQHAFQDLLISGMIRCLAVNPEYIIKRIA